VNVPLSGSTYSTKWPNTAYTACDITLKYGPFSKYYRHVQLINGHNDTYTCKACLHSCVSNRCQWQGGIFRRGQCHIRPINGIQNFHTTQRLTVTNITVSSALNVWELQTSQTMAVDMNQMQQWTSEQSLSWTPHLIELNRMTHTAYIPVNGALLDGR